MLPMRISRNPSYSAAYLAGHGYTSNVRSAAPLFESEQKMLDIRFNL